MPSLKPCTALFAVVMTLSPLTEAALVTDNLAYRWDSGTSSIDDTVWTSSAPAANTTATWARNDPMSLQTVSGSATSFTQAWGFDATQWEGGGYSDDRILTSVGHFGALAPDASFELWVRPAALSGNQVLFETGGLGRGMTIALSGNTVVVIAKQGSSSDPSELVLTHTLQTGDNDDFFQIVFTTNSSNDHRLYVNAAGELDPSLAKASSSISYGDFAGTDAAEIGGTLQAGGSDGDAGGDTIDDNALYTTETGAYTGQIAVINLYDDVLTGAEVQANYNAVIPEPGSLTLIAAAGFFCLGTRHLTGAPGNASK